MFRRRWSGLPEDPEFPVDLKKLGYFIDQETDEIRNIVNPIYYFDYFLSRSERINDRQRFAFNLAVADLIHARLRALGLVKLPLPLGTPTDQPHVPIFVSAGLAAKQRVVLILGEREQDLGVLAHRVASGRGGVDEGSAASLVRALGDVGVGVVLANAGELWWWPEGRRALSPRASMGVPMKSAVHKGRWFDAAANAIPRNEDVDAHVRCVFESVLENPDFVGADAVVDVIGITDGAAAAERYLDANWDRWAARLGCLVMLSTGLEVHELKSDGFKKFLRERSRIYITTQEPLDTPIANFQGNPNTVHPTSFGCPVLSAGVPYYTELVPIKAKGSFLPWMEEVYRKKDYVNPEMEVTFADETFEEHPGWDASRTDDSVAQAGGQEGGLEIITREEWEERQRKLAENNAGPGPVAAVGQGHSGQNGSESGI